MSNSIKEAIKNYTGNYIFGHVIKKYTDVRIFPAIISKKNNFTKAEKKDLTRKYYNWHLYYSYHHNGKMVRQPNISLSINRKFPAFDDRRREILKAQKVLQTLLEEGWSPYNQLQEKDEHTAEASLMFAVELKKSTVSKLVHNQHRYVVKHFIDFLKIQKLEQRPIKEINKSIISKFFNQLLLKNNKSTFNFSRKKLNMLFNVLLKNDIVDNNPIMHIEKLKVKPTRHRVYPEALYNKIFSHLEKVDPYLLLLIKFVSYNFLRNIEVIRLCVGDIDLEEKRLIVKVGKTVDHKVRVIPNILIKELGFIKDYKKDMLVFTNENRPGYSESEDVNRRISWTKRFKKTVKEPFGLDADFTIYGFRHTFITKLYNHLRSQYHITETIDRLKLVTGHGSVSGLKKYLRSINAEMPEDWSEGLE